MITITKVWSKFITNAFKITIMTNYTSVLLISIPSEMLHCNISKQQRHIYTTFIYNISIATFLNS